MKRYQQLRFEEKESCRPCRSFRRDTGQCMSGCNKENVIRGNVCIFETEAYDAHDRLQSECGCYK